MMRRLHHTHMLISPSLLTSESSVLFCAVLSPSEALDTDDHTDCTLAHRQNPAVVGQADKVFVSVAKAIEADMLQGQTANRVVAATKMLIQGSNLNPAPLLQQFSPEAQQTIMAYFA